ncbi:hypothetical protein PU629_05525 [Pullulanibacillus sp. KACC 23026]|uniref:hypothetical protein n=1 Tax=Pullulanibacillus sp. KACC 23026 TaxID=3028315 RepID=UPI0023B17319|nr:hypothetical protein [Pullulanibacillus sp. KACC 23026]WEG13827.1 hypothetical protein PU629_05525 [Pullulanibacillus sp. KACC 23026]
MLRSIKIGVTSFLYFGILDRFAEVSVSLLRSIKIGVTSFPYFGIPARFAED